MTGFGFTETINYSFMNAFSCDRLRLPAGDPRRRLVRILNPLSEEQTVVRTSMIPGMLGTLYRNIAQQCRNLKLFEIGKVFINTSRQELPEESEMLAGLWTGARSPASWESGETACDFYDIKGIVEGLFSALKISAPRFTQMPNAACHYTRPGYTAEIFVGDASVGLAGEIRSEVLGSYDIKQQAYVFELDLDKLFPYIPDGYQVKPVSKFPAISRDITIIVKREIESGSILEKVAQLKEELVESLHLFSMFEGPPIPTGNKSVSFRITYRSVKETLQDETINSVHKDITDQLVEAFHATLPA
jgi:phenylalanyl-tRNA synthetase beta chain